MEVVNMPDKPLDDHLTKKQALASLHGSTGWNYMVDFLETKRQHLQRELKSVKPSNSNRIAAIQAELKLIDKIIDRPKLYFDRINNMEVK